MGSAGRAARGGAGSSRTAADLVSCSAWQARVRGPSSLRCRRRTGRRQSCWRRNPAAMTLTRCASKLALTEPPVAIFRVASGWKKRQGAEAVADPAARCRYALDHVDPQVVEPEIRAAEDAPPGRGRPGQQLAPGITVG
jgi:hypothetical protein